MDFNTVSDLFARNETSSPVVVWNPSRFDISHPVVTKFFEFMQTGGAAVDLLAEAEPPHFFEPWMMVLEPVRNRMDFYYVKYGSEIAGIFGRDLTGYHTSDIGGHISEFFIALYSAVVIRKQSVLSVHVPPASVFASVWRRLIFPLLDDNGNVSKIAAVNVPENDLQAGLEALPDPALVIKESGLLMYANKSARRIFGEPALPRQLLVDYCDMEIELPFDAASYATGVSSEVSQKIGLRNQILVHFEVRTSATFFRGSPYFIVQLKPC